MPMPIAEGSVTRAAGQLKPAGVFAAVGVAVVGCVQVAPGRAVVEPDPRTKVRPGGDRERRCDGVVRSRPMNAPPALVLFLP